jgi:hypothetical protein
MNKIKNKKMNKYHSLIQIKAFIIIIDQKLQNLSNEDLLKLVKDNLNELNK